MSGIQYRPSIDGMRAIAVLAVLLFHLDKSLLPGGFVGVDVFFAISGYLITSIIYDSTQKKSFSIARFYQRRIARIFPVLFVVTLAILVAASFIYAHQDFASAGMMAAASVLSLANMKLMLQGDYFEMSPDGQPFLHFWSLSVEEQFYVFLPLLMLAAQRFRFSRTTLLALLSGLAVTSFLLCLYVTAVRPTWAFYLLPTRAWELLAGAVLAVMTQGRPATDRRPWGAGALVGLAIILLSMVFIHESHNFPGYIAALPIIGSLLVIGRSHHPEQWSERLLSLPPMVWIGKLSYSLYLWHWPIYSFVDYQLFASPEWLRMSLKISLTITLALASYLAVEKPLRVYLNLPQSRRLGFAGLAVGVLAFAVTGYAIRTSNYIDATVASAARGGIEFKHSPTAPRIVLMGDSHGAMYGMLARSLSVDDRLNVNVLSVPATNPFPGSPLYRESIKFLTNSKPDITIFAAAWATALDREGGREKLDTALAEILDHSTYVILLGQPPELPEEATRQSFRERGLQPVYEDPEVCQRRRRANAWLETLQSDRVRVVQVESLFQNPDGTIPFCDELGHQLFHNKTHISGWGALRAKPHVAKAIGDILQRDVSQPQGTTEPPIARLPSSAASSPGQ